MRRHIMIIGGTGMLFDASVALAEQCDTLTSVARSMESLGALDRALAQARCDHHPLRLDWSNVTAFLGAISRHVESIGHPSLVVAWLHQDSLGPRVATVLSHKETPCDFFHIRGSASVDPTSNTDSLIPPPGLSRSIHYHQVILGFIAGREGRGSRWLHDAEISDGVLAAINRRRDIAVVGTVTPWTDRP